MPQDDFELLEIGRAKAQGGELKHPPRHSVAKREEHQAIRSDTALLFYLSASRRVFPRLARAGEPKAWINYCTLPRFATKSSP
jgi:hypothetical protein